MTTKLELFLQKQASQAHFSRKAKMNSPIWRPVLVKIAIIKLPHRSVFLATVALFITLLCIFIGGTIFFRMLLITFSNVNYFNVSLVEFFIGSTNAFSRSYCNLVFDCTANYFLLLVLRIFFFYWRWELFFTASWIYFLAYNTLRACDWGGLGGVWLSSLAAILKIVRVLSKENAKAKLKSERIR